MLGTMSLMLIQQLRLVLLEIDNRALFKHIISEYS